jgi:Suppressor of fused protein (SUFU)
MSVLRRGSASARGSAATIVHTEASPYGSRRLVVESDGVVSAAYLKDARDTVVGAAWVANHRAASDEPDQRRLESGRAPALPSGQVRHPDGRGPLESLEVVWFEEGDGAAVLEDGEPLCVIPGWSDMTRGIPGYSRDAVAQSPFAFPLDDEIEQFSERIERSREHWKVCATEGSWADFQQSILGHLLQRLGPGGNYWHDVARGAAPTVGVSERPARGERDYTVLSTVGMSRQRMPAVELFEKTSHDRVELVLATRMPSKRAAGVFPWLARHPWRSVAWLASGDAVMWKGEAKDFPLNSGENSWDGVLLVEDTTALPGPAAPDLTGLTSGDDPVRWLWLVPITGQEHRYAKSEGSDALVRRLAKQGRSWIS